MKNNSENNKKSKEEIEELEELARIFDEHFEGSTIVSIEEEEKVSISENKIKDFKNAYSYIMSQYKLVHNIKPCIAYVLVNGIADGWRRNAPAIAFECLRVFDRDIDKAWQLLQLYYLNSFKKKSRTISHLSGALKWIYKHTEFKISCDRLSREIPCIGDKHICNKIRGIQKGVSSNAELLENQKLLYLNRFIEYEYFLKLSGKAVKIYLFLLDKYFKEGFDTLYIPYRELAKETKTEYQHIPTYLKELQKANLISYTPGKTLRRIATKIKLLDTTGRKKNRVEKLFKQIFEK